MANPCRCTCVAGSVVALSAADISRLDPFEGVDSRKPDSRDGVYRHEPLLVRVRVDKDEEQGGHSYDWRDAIAYVKNNLEWRGPPSVSYLRACMRNIEQFWCKNMEEEGLKITVRKGDGEFVFEWTEAATPAAAADTTISPEQLDTITTTTTPLPATASPPRPLPELSGESSGNSRGNAATNAGMEHLRGYLASNKLLTDQELKTLQPSTLKVCAVCNQASGELVRLKRERESFIG